MSDDGATPAASVGEVDLEDVEKRFPEQAREIAWLDAQMQRGDTGGVSAPL